MQLSYYWQFFRTHFTMKYLVGIFLIPPLCGLVAALGLAWSPPSLILNQYKVSFTLNSFYYSKSYWNLSIEDIDHPGMILKNRLLVQHGPWLGSYAFGWANIQCDQEGSLLKGSVNFLGTLSYDAQINHKAWAFPEHMQGTYNLLSRSTSGLIKGSFSINQSQFNDAYIEYIYEKNFLGISSLALAAEVDHFVGKSENDFQIYGLKIDLIPSLGSWRGSMIAAMHADRWIENKQNLSDVALEVSIINAKTKRFADFLSMVYYSLPLKSSRDTMKIAQYKEPQEFLDVVDLIDPDWAYINLSSGTNDWIIRVAEGGESIQIDAQGVGTELHALWETIFPRSLLANLNTQSPSWATQNQNVQLSSYNFQPAVWTLATETARSKPASDS